MSGNRITLLTAERLDPTAVQPTLGRKISDHRRKQGVEMFGATLRSDYGRFWDCLLGFLELEETGSRYPDPALQVPLNLGHVSYDRGRFRCCGQDAAVDSIMHRRGG